MTKLFKMKKYIIALLLIMALVMFLSLYILPGRKTSNALNVNTNKLPVYTENMLKGFNGADPSKPIYIGLDGYVYDVTKGKKFYETGGSYHYLAGKDATADLKIFGGGIIKRKYPIVARLKE